MTPEFAGALAAAGLTVAALAVDLARARGRFARWPVLTIAADTPIPDDVVMLTAPGVRIDEATRRAAAAHLAAEDLEAVDLVPQDLDVASALELASVTGPLKLRQEPLARTAGAGHAIVVRESLRLRAQVETPRDPPSLASAAERLRRYAVGRTGTVIVPGLRAIPERGGERAAMLQARIGAAAMGPRLYVEGVRWALAAIALALDVRVGAGLAAVMSIAPTLSFPGLPMRPRDRWHSLVERIPRDLIAWGRACLQQHPHTADIDAARPRYRELLADGTEPFFTARRDTCPLCGDASLTPHVVTTDLLQRKPGRFTLDRCERCGAIFQNPALSPRGLAFYYQDFYDGLNAEAMDDVFASTRALYESRIDTILAAAPPEATTGRWLDVGCGYGHFSLAARQRLPAARFEGLDLSAAVEEGQRRGWLDRAWRMTTGELARLEERFDVVTLSHYLEHTQDPAAEIRFAARLLASSGRLVIEIPNPHCRLGRLLGRWWFPWFQPQHQIFLDAEAIGRLLAAEGLRAASVTYLMTAGDILLSALLVVRRACSAGDVPWASPPGALRRLADLAVWAAALPLFVVALVADAVYSLLPPSQATSNALRVVAVAMEP